MKSFKQSAAKGIGDSSSRSRRGLVYGISGLLVLTVAVAIIAGREKWFSKPVIDAHSGHHSGGPGSGVAKPDAESAALVSTNSTLPPVPAPDGMVWIPGGTFWMGCDDCEMPDAQPVHLVTVDGYWIDRTPVTNNQFAQFVKATGYLTIAEHAPRSEEHT